MRKILRKIYTIYICPSITVVDVNEEAKQEAVEEPVEIEEVKEKHTNEVVDNPPVEEVKEEVKEEQPKPKAKPKPSDRVDCNTCGKNLSYKNYRYRHEKLCTTEPKPVKPQAKPKGKSKPKPIIKQVEVSEQPQEAPKPVIKQQIPQQQSQPSNPLMEYNKPLCHLTKSIYTTEKRKV